MKGDFSRISFDAANRFSRVLQQQGRVTLDADGNEQIDILLHYLRTLARDLIGEYGGPMEHGGFGLEIVDDKLTIGAGRYYVHGILCESDGCDYATQPDYMPLAADAKGDESDALLVLLRSSTPNDQRVWIYLDVWERHVGVVEAPALREIALGGPDTCTRSRVIWQVRAISLDEIVATLAARQQDLTMKIKTGGDAALIAALTKRRALVIKATDDLKDPAKACAAPLEALCNGDGAGMTARLQKRAQPKTPCIIAPDARYRGAENQLYRVEIHHGGSSDQATFKWSRDNGSIVTSWLQTKGADLQVADARGFCAGAWVELSDDILDLRGEPGVLVRVAKVDDDTLTLDAASAAAAATIVCNPDHHSKIRCWDQSGDGLVNGKPVLVANSAPWIDLEDGIQVHFAAGGDYRSGDYWLIPARVGAGANGGIDWPADGDVQPQPPRRVEHHYAPLGFVARLSATGAAAQIEVSSCLCTLRPLTPCQVQRARAIAPIEGGDAIAPAIKSKPKPKPKPKPKHG
ncbi:MAG: DUF6519 domain-containing protein [Dokdonella sp.]